MGATTYNQRLQSLVRIRSTNITDESINLLAIHCPNLTHVDLAHCNEISDDALYRLARSGNSLVKLDLFNTRITARTAIQFVSKHKKLCYISFSRCNSLGPDGFQECIRLMKSVEFLFLRDNALTVKIIETIHLASLPSLVLVDISGSAFANPDAVKLLQSRMPHLLVNILVDNSKKYSMLENPAL